MSGFWIVTFGFIILTLILIRIMEYHYYKEWIEYITWATTVLSVVFTLVSIFLPLFGLGIFSIKEEIFNSEQQLEVQQIEEYNQWLYNARKDKETLGIFSAYVIPDLYSINYIGEYKCQ